MTHEDNCRKFFGKPNLESADVDKIREQWASDNIYTQSVELLRNIDSVMARRHVEQLKDELSTFRVFDPKAQEDFFKYLKEPRASLPPLIIDSYPHFKAPNKSIAFSELLKSNKDLYEVKEVPVKTEICGSAIADVVRKALRIYTPIEPIKL